MANKKISDLLPASVNHLNGDEQIPIATGSTATNKILLKDIGTFLAKDKTSLGLNKVDNTADIDKPVSTATETELGKKADKSHSHQMTEITGLSDALTGKAESTHTHLAASVTDLATAVGTVLSDKKIEPATVILGTVAW